MTIAQAHQDWLSGRGIDPVLAAKLGLTTTRDESGNWLTVPYREAGHTINHKHRQCQSKRFRMDTGAPLTLWNVDCLNDPGVSDPFCPVIITEGEMDALAAMQAGYSFTVSVPNGAPSTATEGAIDPANDAERFKPLWRAREALDKVAGFIIATDADEPGRVLAHELVRRLGAERCRLLVYPDGCKDLNDVLIRDGAGVVSALIQSAKPYPVGGLYTIDDFPVPPPLKPWRLRIPELHEAWPIIPGTLSVVSGYAGNGKTSVLMAVVADLLTQGVNVCLGSFETSPQPILFNELRGHISGCYHAHMDSAQTRAADDMMRERLRIIAQQPRDEGSEFTLEAVLELSRIAVLRDGARVIVLDPWNEVEHKRDANERETDYSNRAIRMMKQFARNYDVALILVAHPRKPVMDRGSVKAPTLYDIAGSAAFANKADFGMIVHRPDRESNVSHLHVTKVRMGMPGKMGSYQLAWEWRTCRYERVVNSVFDA